MALVKRSGLAGVAAEGDLESLASQAFFAKFFPESDDSSQTGRCAPIGVGVANYDRTDLPPGRSTATAPDATLKMPREPHDQDTIQDLQFDNDAVFLGGFGESSKCAMPCCLERRVSHSNHPSSFFNSTMDSVEMGKSESAAPPAMDEKHSQLHDQFNNYLQQGLDPPPPLLCRTFDDETCRQACHGRRDGLRAWQGARMPPLPVVLPHKQPHLQVLLGAYVLAIKAKLPTLTNEDVALLIAKYSKMLSGGDRLTEFADGCASCSWGRPSP